MNKKSMSMPDGERIVTLEVKMIDFEKKLDSVATKLDTLIVMSQSQVSLEDRVRKVEETLKNDSTRKWVFYTLSGVVGAVLTYLVVFFIQHSKF